jgi:hypothetical protein
MKDFPGVTDGGIVIVCVPVTTPLHYPDNRVGVCGVCQCAVQYRPHVPAFEALVCVVCWQQRVEAGDTVSVTPRTIAEVQAYLRRN